VKQSNNRIHAITCEQIRPCQDHHYPRTESQYQDVKRLSWIYSRKLNDLLLANLLIKPTGKTIAPIVRMSPGALVWNHGAVLVERARAQPNEINAPPMKELMNILSILIRAFFAPIRETSSVV
jgi:hypothetical protein